MNNFDILYNKYVYNRENELYQIIEGEKRRLFLAVLITFMWFGSTIVVGCIFNNITIFLVYSMCSALVIFLWVNPFFNKNNSVGSFAYIMSSDILPSITREIFSVEELQNFSLDISISTARKNSRIKSEMYFNINNQVLHIFSKYFAAGKEPITRADRSYNGTTNYRTMINTELKKPFNFYMKLKPPFKNKFEIDASNEDLIRGFLISKILIFHTKHPKEYFKITIDHGRMSIVFYYHRLFKNTIIKFNKENLKSDFEFIYDLIYLLVLPIIEINENQAHQYM